MKNQLIAFAAVAFILAGCSNPLGTKVSISLPYAPGKSTGSLTVTGVTPSSGSTMGSTTITVFGSNFATGAIVKLDGQMCNSVNVISDSKLTCVTSSHSAGWVDILVTNTDSQFASLTTAFDYLNNSGSSNATKMGLAAGGGVSAGGGYRLRGAVGGLPSQSHPTAGDVRMFPGLINVTISR